MGNYLFLLFFPVAVIIGGVFVVATGIRRVPAGKFGVVNRLFAPKHPEDESFYAVRAHGSPGFQAATLKADHRYILPSLLYEVEYFSRIRVPPGTIGVVVAKDGAPLPINQTLGKHVECDNFQDGRAFLLNGGQRGRQLGVLPGDASYAINPKLFDVFTVDTIDAGRDDLTTADLKEIRIPEGTTGVVVVYQGEPPDQSDGALGRRVPGHQSFQLPSVFLDNNGQRGVQEETLSGGGIYRINPWFAQIECVPTRVLVLEWTSRKKSGGNFDSKLDQIRINIEGHWLKFDMSQTIKVPAEAAPRLVSAFGQQETGGPEANDTAPVRRFVDRVLGPLVEGYFQTSFGEYEILNFVSQSNKVCLELEEKVRQALSAWNIEVVRTALHEFEPEGITLDELRRRRAEERDRKGELEHKRENAEIEEEIKVLQLETELRRHKLELQAQVDLLGKDNVAMKYFLTELVKANVPEVVAGNAEALLGYMPLSTAQGMIANAFGRVNAIHRSPPPPQLDTASDTPRDNQLEPETHDNPGNKWWKQQRLNAAPGTDRESQLNLEVGKFEKVVPPDDRRPTAVAGWPAAAADEGSVPADVFGSSAPRQVNAWLAEAEVRWRYGELTVVLFDIGPRRPSAVVSRHFVEPPPPVGGEGQWLYVLLLADAGSVQPVGAPLWLPAEGPTAILRFEVTPARPGPLVLCFRVLLQQGSLLLQELTATVTVAGQPIETSLEGQ